MMKYAITAFFIVCFSFSIMAQTQLAQVFRLVR